MTMKLNKNNITLNNDSHQKYKLYVYKLYYTIYYTLLSLSLRLNYIFICGVLVLYAQECFYIECTLKQRLLLLNACLMSQTVQF